MNFKSTITSLSLIAASSLFTLAHAQTAMPGMPAASAAMPMSVGAMTDGEVRKIDKENKKITLKHGEIKNLEMPGMTMVFQVKDPAMLDMVKAGDKVMFKAEKANGALVVTEIQPVK
jgi:Cu(I)/Ag(I) efflux system protein CusF